MVQAVSNNYNAGSHKKTKFPNPTKGSPNTFRTHGEINEAHQLFWPK
jgi:hypothetical protein